MALVNFIPFLRFSELQCPYMQNGRSVVLRRKLVNIFREVLRNTAGHTISPM